MTARVEAGRRHLNGDGVVHGGVIMAFADAAAAQGAILNLPDGARTTTIESKTNFVRGAQPGVLLCDATPLHLGRSTMLWQSTVRDTESRTLEIVMQTQMVMMPAPPIPDRSRDLSAPEFRSIRRFDTSGASPARVTALDRASSQGADRQSRLEGDRKKGICEFGHTRNCAGSRDAGPHNVSVREEQG